MHQALRVYFALRAQFPNVKPCTAWWCAINDHVRLHADGNLFF